MYSWSGFLGRTGRKCEPIDARAGGSNPGLSGEAPAHFEDILIRFADVKYRDLLRAWGKLREDDRLGREVGTGKYVPKTG